MSVLSCLEKMNDELLIELVRNHPVLYDLSQPKYMDNCSKQDIWNKIGEEMKVDGSSCRSRWNNIRDNYRKSLKKTSTKSGQSAKKIRLYKFSEQLDFLKRYFGERRVKGNIACREDEGNDHDCVVQQQEDKETMLQDAGEPTVSDGGLHEDLQTQPSPSPKPSFEAAVKPSTAKSANNKVAPQQTASAKLMEYLISKQENQTTPHPVDAFLAGIAPTLKTLTPYYLNVAKSEIFATVQKYEMQMLINQHSFER
ncbi:uncharacterized protein LOC143018188 [Oratosquilla oratoria]|uniref:uncharacterized protein LOC143018188 n=1 Tax=Oratosquilla oratoria TaxID=337810 RepID=UPI003F76CC95